MGRTIVTLVVAGSLWASTPASAQSGAGGLNGFVRDEQGGVLPGVTVTAKSDTLLTPVVGVTDSSGYYRLNNLPPGTFAVSAELPGFGSFLREGILVRAGVTFTIDMVLKVGGLEESITVSGESPMIATGTPTSTLTIAGDLLRAAPVTSRRLFSDVLDMAPGVNSRNTDGAGGSRAYYFHGTTLFATVLMLEGAPVGTYNDAGAHNVAMAGDTVADAEVKLGGVDAASPSGTSVVMNVVAPRGGNQFKGSVLYAGEKLAWNSDNTQNGAVKGGTPTNQSVNQWDASLGGPIVKDKLWFFSAYRRADLGIGVSRNPNDLAFLYAFRPSFQPFNNGSIGKQVFGKVTAQLSQKHELTGFYQDERRLSKGSARERDLDQICCSNSGGGVTQGRLQSVWTNRLTTQVSAAYNNKGGNSLSESRGTGPHVDIHQSAPLSRGIPTGNGILVSQGNVESVTISPAEMLVIRGDLTYFREGWGGSHEFKTGVWAAPWLNRDQTTIYSNGGFVLEERRQIDPNNPAAGTVAFHQRFRSPTEALTLSTRDRDVALYIQDSWKPKPRITTNLGLRVDFVRRHDQIFNVDREKATQAAPRAGLSYLVTADASTVLRASYGRLYEQTNGRDYITTFASGLPRGSTLTEKYDANGDGIYETTITTPAATAELSGIEFNKNLHNPFADEFIVGFGKQFPGRLSLDIAGTRRYLRDGYTLVDINGIYPSGPNQPFGGFGLVDRNRGQILQENNRSWASIVMTNVEAVLAKNMSHNIQGSVSLTRQWQHVSGTWGPTDPARFIQPDAFPNNRELAPYLFGNGDTNTLSGGGRESGVAYRPYSVRVAAQYLAPFGIRVGASYVLQAGGWLGNVVTQLSAPNPVFGPATVTLADGTTQSNPLATTIRFCGSATLPCAANPTRGEGQTRNEDERYLQLQLTKEISFGGQRVEAGMSVFNLFNSGAQEQWNVGANQIYSPNYLARFNRTGPRQLQVNFKYRF